MEKEEEFVALPAAEQTQAPVSVATVTAGPLLSTPAPSVPVLVPATEVPAPGAASTGARFAPPANLDAAAVVTCWVGKLPRQLDEMWVSRLLGCCCYVVRWRRLNGPDGKLNNFGFADVPDLASAVRLRSVLHGLQVLPEHKLHVVLDVKHEDAARAIDAEDDAAAQEAGVLAEQDVQAVVERFQDTVRRMEEVEAKLRRIAEASAPGPQAAGAGKPASSAGATPTAAASAAAVAATPGQEVDEAAAQEASYREFQVEQERKAREMKERMERERLEGKPAPDAPRRPSMAWQRSESQYAPPQREYQPRRGRESHRRSGSRRRTGSGSRSPSRGRSGSPARSGRSGSRSRSVSPDGGDSDSDGRGRARARRGSIGSTLARLLEHRPTQQDYRRVLRRLEDLLEENQREDKRALYTSKDRERRVAERRRLMDSDDAAFPARGRQRRSQSPDSWRGCDHNVDRRAARRKLAAREQAQDRADAERASAREARALRKAEEARRREEERAQRLQEAAVARDQHVAAERQRLRQLREEYILGKQQAEEEAKAEEARRAAEFEAIYQQANEVAAAKTDAEDAEASSHQRSSQQRSQTQQKDQQKEQQQQQEQQQNRAGQVDGAPGDAGQSTTAPRVSLSLGTAAAGLAAPRKRVLSAFAQDDDDDDDGDRPGDGGGKRRKLVRLDDAGDEAEAEPAVLKLPKDAAGLFATPVAWSRITAEPALTRRIRPAVRDLILRYLGQEEATMIDHVVSLVKEKTPADEMRQALAPVLDDDAQVFTEKLWRHLVIESRS